MPIESTVEKSRSPVTKKASVSMSVFGAAPSLEKMKYINERTGANEILFRGAVFWYNFRLYYPIIAPVSFSFGLVISLTLWNSVAGHMFIGGMLSLISSIMVCLSYAMIVPWRKHPSTMVFYRAATDILFSFIIILMAVEYHLDSSKGCRGYPVFTQFFLIASECWLTTIALDLVFSLTNPFTSYKGNMRRYHIIVWGFTVLITFALDTNPSCQARVEQGICWLRITNAMDPCLWGYYFIWIIGMYGFQLGAIIFASQRLKKGLPLTFEIRKNCAAETFKCLQAYGAYLVILCAFFVALVSFAGDGETANDSTWNTVSKVFLYLVSCRGYVDSLVWFAQHDFARESKKVARRPLDQLVQSDDDDISRLAAVQISRRRDSFEVAGEDEENQDPFDESPEITLVDFDETALSPQVNMALRQQIVKYVTMGVTKATTGDFVPPKKNVNICSYLFGGIKACTKQDLRANGMKVAEFLLDEEHPFKAFAPDMFHELRMLEGIDDAAFLKALESTEKEQLSEGASGAFMFFCGGMDYIVKTIKPGEATVLHRSLRKYLDYLKDTPSSLLVRFLGSYSLEVYAQTFYFVVMRNIFEPGMDVHERFDIKGSWVNRGAHLPPPNKRVVCRHCNEMFIPSAEEVCSKIVGLHEANVVLKDNDLRTKISLQPRDASNVLAVIKKDSDLLAELGVMDYSLIVGIKKQTFDITVEEEHSRNSSPQVQHGIITRVHIAMRNVVVEMHLKWFYLLIIRVMTYVVCCGQNELLSADFFMQPTKEGEMALGKKKYVSYHAKSVSGPAMYYMGIVDFLQNWNTKKKTERFIKIHIARQDKHGISVMEPLPYRDRFQLKMQQIFDVEDPFGLFIQRGEVRSRPVSEAHLSDKGDTTVMNALHSSASNASLTGPSSVSGNMVKKLSSVSLLDEVTF